MQQMTPADCQNTLFRVALVGLMAAGFTANAAAQKPRPGGLPGSSIAQAITVADVEPHLRFLTSPDQAGRSGKAKARTAEYISKHFQSLKLKPLFENGSFYQSIPGKNGPQGKNVAAMLVGSDPALRDEIMIVSAHYDHLGVRNGRLYPGADDNASGVSMMLEVARQLSQAKPKRSVAFVGFDLEERMLWGSRWFADHTPFDLKRVKFFITADMIGRSLGNLPLPTVFVLGSEHAKQVQTVLDEVKPLAGLEMARLGIDLVGTRSDYGPFRDNKIPFLFFSTGEHPDYHSTRDTLERLDIAKVAKVSTLILDIMKNALNAQAAPVWIDKPEPNIIEAHTLNRITNLLMEKRGDTFSDFQKATVTYVQAKTKQIIERGSMTASERTWLTRSSQLLLLSVF